MKVEKFSIGFGPTAPRFPPGRDRVRPGGDPARRVRQDARRGPRETEASKSTDPRAYPQQVGRRRMAIISAGVIMNVILGLALLRLRLRARAIASSPAEVGRRRGRLARLRGRPQARRRDRRDRRPGRGRIHGLSTRSRSAAAGQTIKRLTVTRPTSTGPSRSSRSARTNSDADDRHPGGDGLSSIHERPFLAPPGVDRQEPKPDGLPGG